MDFENVLVHVLLDWHFNQQQQLSQRLWNVSVCELMSSRKLIKARLSLLENLLANNPGSSQLLQIKRNESFTID